MFSTDVIAAKGVIAEDLSNGEYSFPILVALYSSASNRTVIERVLADKDKRGWAYQEKLRHAVFLLQTEEIRNPCLEELEGLWATNSLFAALWGRKESMSVQSVTTVLEHGKGLRHDVKDLL